MDLKQFITPLVILLLGIGLTILGALFKLMHWQFAPQLLIVGTLAEFFAILLTIRILLKAKSKK